MEYMVLFFFNKKIRSHYVFFRCIQDKFRSYIIAHKSYRRVNRTRQTLCDWLNEEVFRIQVDFEP